MLCYAMSCYVVMLYYIIKHVTNQYNNTEKKKD